MARITPADLTSFLTSNLPGALVQAVSRADVTPAPPAHKSAPGNMLATDDAVVQPARLLDVAHAMRDSLGYRLLTNITAVDFLRDDLIELVYHFAHIDGGLLVIKTWVPRDEPKLPSLAREWPGAALQEREAYDLFGVVFTGHPNLERIYMWEEFDGFPMRKDFPKQGDKYLASGE